MAINGILMSTIKYGWVSAYHGVTYGPQYCMTKWNPLQWLLPSPSKYFYSSIVTQDFGQCSGLSRVTASQVVHTAIISCILKFCLCHKPKMCLLSQHKGRWKSPTIKSGTLKKKVVFLHLKISLRNLAKGTTVCTKYKLISGLILPPKMLCGRACSS